MECSFGNASVRFVIHVSLNSELMRIHNYLMSFFKIIFMAFPLYWAVV